VKVIPVTFGKIINNFDKFYFNEDLFAAATISGTGRSVL
jgi:hypothetical protein